MAQSPQPAGFFQRLAEAFSEVTSGALGDVRNRWEESWFGRELTPDNPGRDMAKQLGWVKETAGELKASLDGLRDELARGRDPAADLERDHGMDR
jgi:hypothetical protein